MESAQPYYDFEKVIDTISIPNATAEKSFIVSSYPSCSSTVTSNNATENRPFAKIISNSTAF